MPYEPIDMSAIAVAPWACFEAAWGVYASEKLSFLQQRPAMRKPRRHFTLRALLETRANVIRLAHDLPAGKKRTQLRRFGILIRALCRNTSWLNANVVDGPRLPDGKPAAKPPIE